MTNKSIFRTLTFLVLVCISTILIGQSKVNIDATVKLYQTTSNNCITVNWVQDEGATKYQLFRKLPTSKTWGNSVLAELPADSLRYTDCDVEEGMVYEYRVLKSLESGSGNGYMTSGNLVPPKHFKGRCLLLIDKPSYDTIGPDLDRYQTVIKSEGWVMNRLIIERDSSAQFVKSEIFKIIEDYGEIDRIVILGHVPVPHSGNISPDGHTNHQGAWSADLYYGELDGNWTDNFVDNSSSGNAKNHNIPNDGNFDQSTIPNDVDIAVGRIDFYDLPAFQEDEFQLLKKYINKSIAYRTKMFTPVRRAVIQDNFNFAEAFAQSGVRAFSTLVSPDSIQYGGFNNAFDKSYLWVYGAGGGSYTSASGIVNTANFASDSMQGVFSLLFGSYFGDYNSKNNLMRSALGSGTTLSCAWAGRPHWAFHPMGMGADLGECTLLSQNNNVLYPTGFGGRSVHVNLIGDPTLTSFVVTPPSNLIASEEAEGHILLEWSMVNENIEGFFLYRRNVEDEQFSLVTPEIITDNFYRESCVPMGETFEYTVRAVKLETTPSGSYYNLSGGPTYQITPNTDHSVKADFTYIQDGFNLITNNSSINATSFEWFVDGTIVSDSSTVSIDVSNIQPITLTLIAKNECMSDTFTVEVIVSGTRDNDLEDFVSVWPNPTGNGLNIEYENAIKKVTLINQLGQVILSKEATLFLDVNHIAPGVYMLEIETIGGMITKKVIKE